MQSEAIQQLERDEQRARQVFSEFLTSVPSEVKDALVALHELVRCEARLAEAKKST